MDLNHIKVRYKDKLLSIIFTRNVEAVPEKLSVPYSISAYEEEATPEYVSLASLIQVPDSVALTLFPDPVTV